MGPHFVYDIHRVYKEFRLPVGGEQVFMGPGFWGSLGAMSRILSTPEMAMVKLVLRISTLIATMDLRAGSVCSL